MTHQPPELPKDLQVTWRHAYQTINLMILVAVLATNYRVWITEVDSVRGVVQRVVLTALLVATSLEAWKLHFRSTFWLPPLAVPLLTSAATCLAVWYVDPLAFVWVLTCMFLVYMRLPLRAAQAVSFCAYAISLAIMALYWKMPGTNLLRFALSGLIVQMMLSLFFRINRQLLDQLGQTSELLTNAIESVSQGIAVIDRRGRYKLFNARSADMLNLPRELLERKPLLSEVVRFQAERGDFGPDFKLVEDSARDYVAGLGEQADGAVPPRYVRQDAEGRFIEVQSHSTPSGDVVRTYADVSEYEHVNRQLKVVLQEYRQLSQQMLNRSREQMVLALTELALHRDNETGEHIKRTQLYVKTLAHGLTRAGHHVDQLSDARLDLIAKATPMHDLGKVGIPDHILLKPGRHTDEETKIMRTHATIGESILLAASGGSEASESLFVIAARMAGGHHENWDGSGYPRGLQAEAIPLEGRLMSLADVYDALTTPRVYKRAWSHEEARAHIVGLKGSKFDPVVVDAFLSEESTFRDIGQALNHAPT